MYVYMDVYFCSFIMIVLMFSLIVIHKCYLHLTIVEVISSEVVVCWCTAFTFL